MAEVVRKTLEETPADVTHWSLRSMASAVGYSPSTIHAIWKAFSLKPHRSETVKWPRSDPYPCRFWPAEFQRIESFERH